eukprot:1160829-Pelagomonas_calceolata.AAC.2
MGARFPFSPVSNQMIHTPCRHEPPARCRGFPSPLLLATTWLTFFAGAELPFPAMDPRHPLVSWLLHCFVSAPLHPGGPLCAFKEPGAMVRAVTALLQIRCWRSMHPGPNYLIAVKAAFILTLCV